MQCHTIKIALVLRFHWIPLEKHCSVADCHGHDALHNVKVFGEFLDRFFVSSRSTITHHRDGSLRSVSREISSDGDWWQPHISLKVTGLRFQQRETCHFSQWYTMYIKYQRCRKNNGIVSVCCLPNRHSSESPSIDAAFSGEWKTVENLSALDATMTKLCSIVLGSPCGVDCMLCWYKRQYFYALCSEPVAFPVSTLAMFSKLVFLPDLYS